MKQIVLPSVVVGILCGACATSSDKVAATYVSPIQYSNLSCTQIREEAGRVSVRAAQAAGAQDEKRRGDQVATTVGAVGVPARRSCSSTATITRRPNSRGSKAR